MKLITKTQKNKKKTVKQKLNVLYAQTLVDHF